MIVVNIIIAIVLIILSGIFSGLTLGLMSLDVFDLNRKVKLGDKNAKKVYPLRREGNLLLVTLLLGNVAVNSGLSIFLGTLTTGVLAGVVATSLIVVFGEVIPQSVFSRHALRFGAKMTWLVYIFLYAFYPISKPLAVILDKFLGGELPTIFSKKEFRVFLEEQKNHKNSDIKKHEFDILQGGLIFSEKSVKDVMTPRVNVFFLNKNTRLTLNILKKIHRKGHTRIPVYNKTRDELKGILYTKDLVLVDAVDAVFVKEVMRKDIHYINEDDKLDKVLDLFKEKKIHMFVVRDKFNGIAGIVTLEDILEEIVGEIEDEYDLMTDMRVVN